MTGDSAANGDRVELPGSRWAFRVVGLMCIGLLVAAADAYAVATLLPRMLADTGLPIDRFEQATPLVSGFLAGYVAALPLVGTLSDRRGRMPVYIAALAVFGVGSLVTAAAPDLGWMVVGRAVQGLGGGAMVPVTLAVTADLVSGTARDRWIGGVSAVQEAGSVVGPAYGAVVAAAAPALGWRLVFLINVPVACAIGVLALFVRRRAAGRLARSGEAAGSGSRAGRGSAVAAVTAGSDLPSAVALGAGLAATVLALYPDDPGRSAVNRYFAPIAVVGVVLLAVYGWRQFRTLAPLIPLRVLRDRSFLGSLGTNLLVGAALMVVLVDVPVFARGVFDVDQGRAGLLLTSFLVGIPLGALAGGYLSGRLGRRPVAAAGLIGVAAGFAVLAGWDAATASERLGPLPRADAELAVIGIAFGVVIAPVAAAALEAAGNSEHGLISSLVVAARTIGMLLALAVLTAFGLYRFRQLLASQPTPPDNVSLHDRLKALEAAVTHALVLEYHEIFLVAAGLSIVAAAIAALTLGSRRPASTGRG